MRKHENHYREAVGEGLSSGISPRALLISLMIGILAGTVTSLYRITLGFAEESNASAFVFVRENWWYLPVLAAGLVCVGLLIAALTAKFRMIGGSGIPQVKGIIMGHLKANWLKTIVAKFGGGALALLGGLSLGREGPSVQLGACMGQGLGGRLGQTRLEKRIYIAAGASAGLSAAFNAPLAGVLFCLEEIFKYFSPAILLSSMIAAVAADFVSRLFFGGETVFNFQITGSIPLEDYWILLLMGAALGALGALYNLLILRSQAIYRKIGAVIGKWKNVIPFVFAGVLGWVFPYVLGGGNALLKELDFSAGLGFLALLFVAKLLFSAVSFGSGAPGGIFFPLLTLGAAVGAFFAKASVLAGVADENCFYNFLILAMAGYFTAIVRAPITGVILLVEMTGSFSHLLPLTLVAVCAYVTAEFLHSKPIYDSLLENILHENGQRVYSDEDDRKITIEMPVRLGSPADGKTVRELAFPKKCLLIAVKRGNAERIPNGATKLSAGDMLIFITDLSRETEARRRLEELTGASGEKQ